MLCLQEEQRTWRTVGTRWKPPKLSVFIPQCIAKGIVRPTDIRFEYQTLYPKVKPKTLEAYSWHCKKLGFTKEVRDKQCIEVQRKAASIHILDYPEVKEYVTFAGSNRTQQRQIDRVSEHLTELWNLMGCTDPHLWTHSSILEAIETKYPKVTDNRGRVTYDHPAKVLKLLSSFNTAFPGKLRRGFHRGLMREAGELKDYLRFDEFDLFNSNLTDTVHLSVEGWTALYKSQVNMGCREGHDSFLQQNGTMQSRNGILSLSWGSIDYDARRCSLHEKGGHGNASRVWNNLPLDLFPWLHSWEALMTYHKQRYGYVPTNEHHEQGPAFPGVLYDEYRRQFHDTRRRCNGRISGDKETMRPHVLRMTHAQWLVKLWVPIEQICGIFPDGYFGVGWDDPKILLKYYITLENEQRSRTEQQATERMTTLGLIPALVMAGATAQKEVIR